MLRGRIRAERLPCFQGRRLPDTGRSCWACTPLLISPSSSMVGNSNGSLPLSYSMVTNGHLFPSWSLFAQHFIFDFEQVKPWCLLQSKPANVFFRSNPGVCHHQEAVDDAAGVERQHLHPRGEPRGCLFSKSQFTSNLKKTFPISQPPLLLEDVSTEGLDADIHVEGDIIR